MKTVFALSAFLALPAVSAAAMSPEGIVRGELLTGWRTADGTHIAGLRLSLAEGWKTYWRAPGEGGIPPRFDWAGSDNITGFSPSWPVPEVFDQNGLRSVGYTEVVVLPLTFEPDDPDADITVSGRIDIGVCEDVCVPMTLRVAATLAHDATRKDPRIVAALADRPLAAGDAGVSDVSCRIDPISDGMRVSAEIRMPRLGNAEEAVIELSEPPVWVSPVEVARSGGVLHASADLVPAEGAPFALARSALRFTVLAAGRAVDIRGCD